MTERCREPEHRQFDFWLGTWDVRNTEGDVVGHNEIQRVARGCALLEDWRGAGGSQGLSINTYDVDRRKWTQRWVGSGATLWLEGGLEDGRMVLAGTAPRRTPDGEVLDRIIWTPLPDGRVRQVWEISAEGDGVWRELFVGYYSAAGRSAAHPPTEGQSDESSSSTCSRSSACALRGVAARAHQRMKPPAAAHCGACTVHLDGTPVVADPTSTRSPNFIEILFSFHGACARASLASDFGK